MKTEIELLREIADEAKKVWDRNGLPSEAIHLKNLLTDRIDFNERHASQPSDSADGSNAVRDRAVKDLPEDRALARR